MNNTCHNCGGILNNNKRCPKCGTKAFENEKGYSEFTTKTLTSRRIIICAVIILVIASIITIIFMSTGIKPEIGEYDTSYNQDNYKCNKATNCQGSTCTYINENGVEETIQCSSTNWYNQDTN